MPSRRQQIVEHYLRQANRSLVAKRAATATARQEYHGEAVIHAVVVRADLNGYSKWARSQPVAGRVAVLDNFFSSVVVALDEAGGIYFRDEGDCVVALFSDYFGTNASYDSIRNYCQTITRASYGAPNLTAKTVVCVGETAIFQKSHEVGTEDWSAEGEVFVRAARLEQAVDSKQTIYFFKDEYNGWFAAHVPLAPAGQSAFWLVDYEAKQVPGLGNAGGWTDLATIAFVPGGTR